jgi:hypothetical protein
LLTSALEEDALISKVGLDTANPAVFPALVLLDLLLGAVLFCFEAESAVPGAREGGAGAGPTVGVRATLLRLLRPAHHIPAHTNNGNIIIAAAVAINAMIQASRVVFGPTGAGGGSSGCSGFPRVPSLPSPGEGMVGGRTGSEIGP